jgi:hypothetical protein
MPVTRDVWAVGERQDNAGTFRTLVEHWNGRRWSVVPSPNPGATGNCLFDVAAAGPRDAWAVGQRSGTDTDTPLVEHWNGHRWTVVTVPSAGLTGSLLQGVAVSGTEVWAVGQSDDAADQARPLVEHLAHGTWTARRITSLGSGFSNVTGVAIVSRTAWLVGSALDEASGNQLTLVARNTGRRLPRRTRVAATGFSAGYRRRAAPRGLSGPSTATAVATHWWKCARDNRCRPKTRPNLPAKLSV